MLVATLMSLSALVPAQESVKPSLAGVFLCTTAARAGIRSLHFESAGPPTGFVDKDVPTKFKMRIKPNADQAKPYLLDEVKYEGGDRDPYEWQDEHSVLHGSYIGDGEEFSAVNGPAFLSLYRTKPTSDGDFAYYHAGYEIAGGEDTNLVARWGRCKKLD
jgi:hypothetical protein